MAPLAFDILRSNGQVIKPESIAVGSDGLPWIVASNIPWRVPSNDGTVFQLVQYSSPSDTAWVPIPGGATQISISPDGFPWISTYENQGFLNHVTVQ